MNEVPQTGPQLEFSRPIEAESLIHGESNKSYTASQKEREALARRFSLEKLNTCSAILNIRRTGSGRRLKVRVNGQLSAEIVQICVVSLDPFASKIEAEFETFFDCRSDADIDQVDLDVIEEDPAEPIVEGIIDLGELIAQSLGLEFDLHPRKPGVTNEFGSRELTNHSTKTDDIVEESPFSVLQSLKINPKN